jgi:hypothetical protein
MAEVLEKAGDEIGNGCFIVRQLGAERYLDYETVAVLITRSAEPHWGSSPVDRRRDHESISL